MLFRSSKMPAAIACMLVGIARDCSRHLRAGAEVSSATWKCQSCPTDMPFWASSFFAFSFLERCVRPIPRSTLGALLNWMLS